MLEELYATTTKRMDAAIDTVKKELGSLRTGRATVQLLDPVRVDYYGTPTPIAQVCKLSVPEPGMIVASPFDPSQIKDIEKAIKAADLGLNPSNDGKVIRIPIPPLNDERRKQLVKKVNQAAEDGKNAIRGVRRDANDAVKSAQKDSKVSEDDAKRGLDKIQKLTDEHVKKVEELAKAKEKEIAEV